MTYRQAFDTLGNRCHVPDQVSLQHRIIRWASVAVIVACIAIMLWGR